MAPLLLFLLSYFLFLTTTTLAQSSYTPIPYFFLQSVFLDGNALFIHGGLESFPSSNKTSTQTFFLNLSTSWNTSSPDFQKLPGRNTGQWGSSSTLLSDKRTWILFDNQTTISQFDIGARNRRWVTTETRQLGEGFRSPSIAAVTDPRTDQVFVVDGWNSTGLLSYFPANQSVDEVGPRAPVSEGYAAVWSTVRRAMLVHGGTVRTSTGKFFPRSLFQFYPTKNDHNMTGPPLYAPLTDTGDIPPPRVAHCMVEAKNGTKIVVFGGFDEDGAELGDVYVLDVATLEWTAGGRGGGGMNVSTTVARGYAACGMSNNLLVAWGGARRDPRSPGSLIPVSENITVVYNLTSQMWQTTFAFKAGENEASNVPTIFRTTDISPTAAATATPDPSSTLVPPGMGAIVGGSVVGGLTLIAAAGVGLFFYRRRKLQSNQVQPALSSSSMQWSDIFGHSLERNNHGGGGGGVEDPGHSFLRLESAKGSSVESVNALREDPISPLLAHGQHQQQQSTEIVKAKGGRSNNKEILPQERKDSQLVMIGRAFTYRDTSIDSTTTSTTLHP